MKAQLGTGKAERFVPGDLQLRTSNGISPLTQEYAEKEEKKKEKKDWLDDAYCFVTRVLLRLKQRNEWNVPEHGHYQHQSHNIH